MRTGDQRGFLLLEVLLAVALVGMSLFVLLEGLGRCLAAARSIQNYSISATLLANKSYEFEVERPEDYENQDGGFDDYPNHRWERTLEPTETEDLWKQTITVSWHERNKLASDAVVQYRYLPEKPQ